MALVLRLKKTALVTELHDIVEFVFFPRDIENLLKSKRI